MKTILFLSIVSLLGLLQWRCSILSFPLIKEANLNKDSIIFRDTFGDFVTDSLHHDFGKIDSLSKYVQKPFRYIGDSLVLIRRAYTRDPHYICKYPKEILQKDSTYYFTICFANRKGYFVKAMGLYLSDGTRLPYKFKGQPKFNRRKY